MKLDFAVSVLLALVLAVLVWFVAANEQDQFIEQRLPQPISVRFASLGEGLMNMGPQSVQTTVTLRGPQSLLNTIDPATIDVVADLTGLGPGEHDVELQYNPPTPLSLVSLSPQVARVRLEAVETRVIDIQLQQSGEPSTGFEAGTTQLSVITGTVTGPTSLVDRVSMLAAPFSIAGARRDVVQAIDLRALDIQGQIVSGVTIEPKQIDVSVPIVTRPGYREVVVRVIRPDEPADGYYVSGEVASPSVVTISSSDARQVNDLPGFVETEPISIEGSTEDVIKKVGLVLPEGVTVQGEPAVTVQILIEPIIINVTIPSIPVEPINVEAGFNARVEPETVSAVIRGPVALLNQLKAEDIQLSVDLAGQTTAGTVLLTPNVVAVPENLSVESIQPAQVQVVVARGPRPTRTPTSRPTFTLTPTPTQTLLPLFTPTPTATATPQ